ncbi:hypothetical protein AB0M95_25490 [Sphaerisporangium sp. NPDC051017]|uniref:hypothetical protein n=1 Tax=Sphaerisporangium sp. NPDC051017 TaxID=3154636 RepID=UPI00342127B8
MSLTFAGAPPLTTAPPGLDGVGAVHTCGECADVLPGRGGLAEFLNRGDGSSLPTDADAHGRRVSRPAPAGPPLERP